MSEQHDKTRIFISYSRKDMDAALELRDQLIEEHFDAYLDVHDIVKGEPWQERLRSLIERADTLLFLVSPDSVASEICEWEVNGAELNEKRILPVVVRPTPTTDIPQRLARLNFTFLDTSEKWPQEFDLLVTALNEDVMWVREHTRLGEVALRWDRAGRPGRSLLSGADLTAAEGWRDRRASGAPELSTLHRDFIRRSRERAQLRLRTWLIAISALAIFAAGLSTFAYWQRSLAIENGELAERRAAVLATDVALVRGEQGALNQGLLMLLDASKRYAPGSVPEKLLLAMRELTRKAMNSRAFWFSAKSRAFHHDGVVIVADPDARAIFRIDPISGEQRKLSTYGGEDIAATVVAGQQFVYITAAHDLYSVPLTGGGQSAPHKLVSLLAADEVLSDSFRPTLRRFGAGGLAGIRIVRVSGAKDLRIQLWRYDVKDGSLQRTAMPDSLGEWVGMDGERAFFWDRRKQRVRALELGGSQVRVLSTEEAVAAGIAPCEQSIGETPPEHLRAIYAIVKPGLEAVRCAGLYGPLALIAQTRALARRTMDEYFLFPLGSTAAAAREQFSLANATERLGSLGMDRPFAWHTGSDEAAMVAVAHADRVLLLGSPARRYVSSKLYADGDSVAREIATPDITDGGGFHGDSHFTYSGPDAERYRVTVHKLERDSGLRDAPVAEVPPERAYWGSCGVQRPEPGNTPGVSERAFSVTREAPGRYRVAFGARQVVVGLEDVKCATVSGGGERLAVVHAGGVALFDVDDANAEPALLAQIADPSTQTVSFLGPRQQTLLTAHDYKVMNWRRGDSGGYQGTTVLRSKRSVYFAEGAPDADRMLVWLGAGGADASIELLPVPQNGMKWLSDGPHMLVVNPDVFFDRRGAVYRREQGMVGELMPPVSLAALRRAATAALSPSCRLHEPGNYRSSPCWPASF